VRFLGRKGRDAGDFLFGPPALDCQRVALRHAPDRFQIALGIVTGGIRHDDLAHHVLAHAHGNRQEADKRSMPWRESDVRGVCRRGVAKEGLARIQRDASQDGVAPAGVASDHYRATVLGSARGLRNHVGRGEHHVIARFLFDARKEAVPAGGQLPRALQNTCVDFPDRDCGRSQRRVQVRNRGIDVRLPGEDILRLLLLGDVLGVADNRRHVGVGKQVVPHRGDPAPGAVAVLHPKRIGMGVALLAGNGLKTSSDVLALVGVDERERVLPRQRVGTISKRACHRRAGIRHRAIGAQEDDEVGTAFKERQGSPFHAREHTTLALNFFLAAADDVEGMRGEEQAASAHEQQEQRVSEKDVRLPRLFDDDLKNAVTDNQNDKRGGGNPDDSPAQPGEVDLRIGDEGCGLHGALLGGRAINGPFAAGDRA